MEVFENAATAGAQLLKAKRLAQAGDDETPLTSAYLLTFDVGRVLLAADPVRGRLVANTLPDVESVPGGLVDASEDEPWWRLLGCSLAQATSQTEATSLRLDFRISDDGLRSLDLVMTGGVIRAKLAGAAG
jgi:hypothetical protein